MLEELMEETGWAEYWRREGRLEGERRVLLLALEGRFGALSDDVVGALAGADEDTIRDLAENVSRHSLAEIRQRLGLG